MEQHKEKLRILLWEMIPILIRIQENYKMYDFSTKRHEKQEENYLLQRNWFFQFSSNNMLDVIILNLSKLYNGTEDYSLNQLVNKLSKNNEFGQLEIPIDKVRKWKKSIKENKEIIKSIINIRNNFIAHKSKLADKLTVPRVSKANLKQLIETAQNIFISIYDEVYETSFIPDPIIQPIDDLKEIVSALSNSKRKELAPLIELEKKYDLN